MTAHVAARRLPVDCICVGCGEGGQDTPQTQLCGESVDSVSPPQTGRPVEPLPLSPFCLTRRPSHAGSSGPSTLVLSLCWRGGRCRTLVSTGHCVLPGSADWLERREYPSVAVSTIRPRRNTEQKVWRTQRTACGFRLILSGGPTPRGCGDSLSGHAGPQQARSTRRPQGLPTRAPAAHNLSMWKGGRGGGWEQAEEGGCIEGTPAGMGTAWPQERRRPPRGTSLGLVVRGPPSCSAPAPCIWATWLEHLTRGLDCCWVPLTGGATAGRPPRCVKPAEAGTRPRGPHREPLGCYLPHCIARAGSARAGGLFVCRAAAACVTRPGWSRGRAATPAPTPTGTPAKVRGAGTQLSAALSYEPFARGTRVVLGDAVWSVPRTRLPQICCGVVCPPPPPGL